MLLAFIGTLYFSQLKYGSWQRSGLKIVDIYSVDKNVAKNIQIYLIISNFFKILKKKEQQDKIEMDKSSLEKLITIMKN